MLPTQARASHTSPQGCFVHHWNVCVEHCLQLHPICTMCTGQIHEVPAYPHWPKRHFFWDAGTLIGGPPVRVRLRPGTYHILVLTELQRICRTGAQGDRSLLNALSRKCYMHTLQYVHRGTLP